MPAVSQIVVSVNLVAQLLSLWQRARLGTNASAKVPHTDVPGGAQEVWAGGLPLTREAAVCWHISECPGTMVITNESSLGGNATSVF